MKFINKYAILLTASDLHKALTKNSPVYPYYENKNGKMVIAYSCGHAEYDKTAHGNMNTFTFSDKEVEQIAKNSPKLKHNIINLAPIMKFHLTLAYQKSGNYMFITVHDKFDNSIFTITGNPTDNEFRLIAINAGVNKKVINSAKFTNHDFVVIMYEIEHILHAKINSTFTDNVKWFNLIINHPQGLAGRNFPITVMNTVL